MDTKFTFPPPQRPIPRNNPVKTAASAGQTRESSALRASVLDVALELGITGDNSLAAWMFDNSLKEEDEEEVSFFHSCFFYSSSCNAVSLVGSPGTSHARRDYVVLYCEQKSLCVKRSRATGLQPRLAQLFSIVVAKAYMM